MPEPRRGSRLVLATAVAGLIAVALYLLAAGIVGASLDRRANADWAAYSAGASPWHWQPRDARDVVASRAFGSAHVVSAANGLRMVADDPARGYEIGLPLPRPAALDYAPRLRVQYSAPIPLRLRLVVRQRLDAPARLSDVRIAQPDKHSLTLDTRDLAWQDIHGIAVAAPTRAAMLRLRIEAPAPRQWILHQASLMPASDLGRARVQVLRLSASAGNVQAIATTRTRPPLHHWWLLPRGRPEQQLQWRDVLARLQPSALAAVSGPPAVIADARTKPLHAGTAITWIACAVAVLLLLWRVFKPPSAPAVRTMLELAIGLGPPLWLACSLRYDGHLRTVDLALLAPAAAMLAWSLYRDRHDWRWLGPASAWTLPMLAPLLALGLLLAFHAHPTAPTLAQIFGYLAWALLQQCLMLVFAARRLVTLSSTRVWAVLAVATTFALLHLPNATLMLLCLAAQALWTACFLRWRVLGPVVIAHTAAALLLQAATGALPLRSLEIGSRFLQ